MTQARICSGAAARPLIAPVDAGGHAASPQTIGWREGAPVVALITVVTLLVYWPTLRNGFLPLGFDDALIPDTPALHGLAWSNLWAMTTEFAEAHYTPLTMLSLALDYHFWGLNPVGYHLTNIVLHATTAVLVWIFLLPIVRSSHLATVAALLFAVHPVQMEAVSVAVQRKTLLSGALFFLTLILFGRWRTKRLRRHYAASVLAFTAAALAKPSVMTLPFVLLLYEYTFVGGRLRLADKLPFLAVAAFTAVMAAAAHAVVGAIHPPHGGNVFANLLMVGRVTLEYVDALFLPVGLAPIYYYPKDSVYSPLHFAALILVITMCALVTLNRRRYPWSFFCLWWFLLELLPECNLMPLAQLRADRFLYLAIVGFAIWVALGMERVQSARSPKEWQRRAIPIFATALIGLLALTNRASVGVWRDNISAWRQVVARHPWCAMAHSMLGRAYFYENDYGNAEPAFAEATRLSAQLPDAHLYLAKIYADRGEGERAQVELQRLLALTPDNPDGLRLLAVLSNPRQS